MARKRRHHFNYAEAINTAPDYVPSYTKEGQLDAPDPYIGAQDTTTDPRFDVTLKKPYIGEIVTRSTVWDYYRTTVALPNPSLILTKLGKGVEAYDDLLEDGRVKAALNNRRAGTLSQKWTLDQNGCPARMYKTIKKIFDNFDVYALMSEMLTYNFYGFHCTEVIWGMDGSMIIPVHLSGKAQRWFFWDDTNTLRYRTKVNQTLGEPLPPRKFLVARYHPRYDDPYSGHEALATSVYWPVHFRRMVLNFATNFAEKYGTPWLDVEMDDVIKPERLQEILNVLQQTHQDGIVAHPNNTKITPLEIGGTKNMDIYTSYLDWLNKEIDMAILGNNLSTEVKGGSYAASRSHMEVRQDVILEDVRTIETNFDTLIQWICWYNYPADTQKPLFKLFENEPATKDRAEIDIMLAKMGVKFSKEYFERSYGINSEEFEIGAPAPDLAPGTKGAVAGSVDQTAEEAGDEATNATNAKKIQEAGIESSDAASNQLTKQSVAHAQKKGYPV